MTAIPLLFLAKAHVKQYTRRDGTVVKEHDDKRQGARPGQLAMPHMGQAPVAGPGRQAAAMPPSDQPPAPGGQGPAPSATQGQGQNPAQGQAPGQPAPAQYGVHNVKPGDRMRFQAGGFQGQGEVVSAGEDGAKIKDATGREHGVHWHEMQGRHEEQGQGQSKPGQAQGQAESRPDQDRQSQPPAASAATGQGGARRFFSPEEMNALPDKETVRQTVFNSWESAAAIGPQALAEYKGMLDNLGQQLGFSPGRGSPDEMSEADLDSDESFIFLGPLKKQEKSTDKVNTDYFGDWTQLKDLVRATIAVRGIEDVHGALDGLKRVGLNFAQKPKDNMTHGTKDGYRDLNLIVKLPQSGLLAELQIAVKQISKVKPEAHEYYNANIKLDQKRKKMIAETSAKDGLRVAEGGRAYQSDNEDDINNWPDKADFKQFLANRHKQQEIYGGAWAKVPGIDMILKALRSARGKLLLLFRQPVSMRNAA